MRAPIAALLIASLMLVPTTVGHDADADYRPGLVVVGASPTAPAAVITSPLGWTCGGVTNAVPQTAGKTAYEVTCTPPAAPAGLSPGCTDVYAGAIAWYQMPDTALTHFPDPTQPSVGTLDVTTTCELGGALQTATSVSTPMPGMRYKGIDVEVHADALVCHMEVPAVAPLYWVAQCAVNTGFVGTGP